MKTFLITLIIILTNISINAQLSGTYIVGGPNGDYPNPSIAIQSLVQQGVSGPVVFEIYSGSYHVKEAIPPIMGTSLHNTVTFISQTQNADDVEFYNTTNDNASSYIILLKGGQNIIFKNIKFSQKGLSSGCLRIGNYSGNIKMYGNIFEAPFSSWTNSGNPLIGYYLNGFLFGSFEIIGNVFNKGYSAMDFNSNSIYDKVVINKNTIKEVYEGIIVGNVDTVEIGNNSIEGMTAVLGINTVNYAIIKENIIYSSNNNYNLQADVSISGVKSINNTTSLFFNNFIVGYGRKPFVVTHNKNINIFNNTVLVLLPSSIDAKIYINSNTNLNFKNNILINDSSAYLAAIRGNSNSSFDYNVYYTANDTIFNDGYGIVHTSLASWQAATGYDAHSIFIKPNFSKPNDLHLQANNPQIIGAGTPLTLVPKDIDGENRDATHPDIGADEYSLRPIIDSVVWGCAGSTVTLDAGAGFSSYLWSNNATTQTIAVDTNGIGLSHVFYSVTVGYGGNSSSATTKVIWQDCTSLLHHQKEDINVKVFPNPTNGIVSIEIPDKIRDFEVRVYNSNGSLLMSKSNQKRINLSGNAVGIYFIQILTDESSVMRKVILR